MEWKPWSVVTVSRSSVPLAKRSRQDDPDREIEFDNVYDHLRTVLDEVTRP